VHTGQWKKETGPAARKMEDNNRGCNENNGEMWSEKIAIDK